MMNTQYKVVFSVVVAVLLVASGALSADSIEPKPVISIIGTGDMGDSSSAILAN